VYIELVGNVHATFIIGSQKNTHNIPKNVRGLPVQYNTQVALLYRYLGVFLYFWELGTRAISILAKKFKFIYPVAGPLPKVDI